ncbi:hypothetical protein N7474_008313, partial [Penicillium riverlandense]|uniref:uncharacterized protein n=1 Tax=Penicillium riverlandense TaxID=1903569 RepID=UPI0025486396
MTISKIRVTRLAHVHYAHPDLDKALEFLQDFGLVVKSSRTTQTGSRKSYLRGYGTQPFIYVAEQSSDSQRHFLGGYWVVESAEDLHKAASHPNAVAGIEESIAPGGGQVVRLRDPNGIIVGFVHGQTLCDTDETTSRLEVKESEYTSSKPNEAVRKDRRGGFRRFQKGASPVHKLGHYGLIVPAGVYQGTLDWYWGLMNLKPSDYVVNPETGVTETVFNHVDLGKEYTDHHSFFLASSDKVQRTSIHHSSFEVNDFDTQVLGHDFLQSKGWVNCWGIGRHIMGSQIFDYWFDASGNIIEHYSDGDLVNEDSPVSKEPAGPQSLYVWGPNVPLAFVSGKVEDAEGYKVLKEPDV